MPSDRAGDDVMQAPLDLANPVHLRAEMARAGIAPQHLQPWDSPDSGWMNPLDDREVQAAVRSFMFRLWNAALRNEAPTLCAAVECDEPAPKYHVRGVPLCTRHALIAEAVRLAEPGRAR